MSTSNTKYKIIIVALLLLCMLSSIMALVFFNQTKDLKKSLQLANQKLTHDTLSFAQYRSNQEKLLKVLTTYDSGGQFLNEKGNLSHYIDTLLKSLSIKKTVLGNEVVEKQDQIKRLNDQLVHLSSKKDSSDNKISLLKTDLVLHESQLDSISNKLAKIEVEMSKTAIDSLIIYSPKGVMIYFYGKTFKQMPKDFGVGFYVGKGHYVGEWKGNMRHGRGRHTYKDNSLYEGSYINDLRSGFGTYYYATGEVYKGNWQDDLMEGDGEIIQPDGTSVKGIWKDGKIIKHD